MESTELMKLLREGTSISLSEEDYKELTYQRMIKNVANYNELEGGLKYLDCPTCKNKGYIGKVEYDKETGMYFEKYYRCKCMKRRKLLYLADKGGLGKYITLRFTDFEDSTEWQKKLKQLAINYCKSKEDYWWAALGQSGSGKTMISCTIANYLLLEKEQEVMYVTWTDFVSKLKRDIMSDNAESVTDYLEKVKKVKVLYLDELLKKYTEADLRYLIEIINYRYANNLKTIISSERMISELLEIDEATFGRVVEKCGKYLVNIGKDKSKNHRLQTLNLGGNF